LTACGTKEIPKPEVRVVETVRAEKPKLKPDDLRCGEEPAAPAIRDQPDWDKRIGNYITALLGWGRCGNSKLEVVRKTLEP